MPPAHRRAAQIAALYSTEHAYLTSTVARRAHVDAQTVEDACSHAWTQLLRHPTVDLDNEPRQRIRGWLTTTAAREAWRLNARQRKTHGVTEHDLGVAAVRAGTIVPSLETIALLRERLDLVRQIPERPRRFLLRLMLGYSYNEIAAQENTSYRVVNRQVARAKRLLRQIDDRANP
jgi:DNA-directed RNA polymerase specialized sigma24 family protein